VPIFTSIEGVYEQVAPLEGSLNQRDIFHWSQTDCRDLASLKSSLMLQDEALVHIFDSVPRDYDTFLVLAFVQNGKVKDHLVEDFFDEEHDLVRVQVVHNGTEVGEERVTSRDPVIALKVHMGIQEQISVFQPNFQLLLSLDLRFFFLDMPANFLELASEDFHELDVLIEEGEGEERCQDLRVADLCLRDSLDRLPEFIHGQLNQCCFDGRVEHFLPLRVKGHESEALVPTEYPFVLLELVSLQPLEPLVNILLGPDDELQGRVVSEDCLGKAEGFKDWRGNRIEGLKVVEVQSNVLAMVLNVRFYHP